MNNDICEKFLDKDIKLELQETLREWELQCEHIKQSLIEKASSLQVARNSCAANEHDSNINFVKKEMASVITNCLKNILEESKVITGEDTKQPHQSTGETVPFLTEQHLEDLSYGKAKMPENSNVNYPLNSSQDCLALSFRRSQRNTKCTKNKLTSPILSKKVKIKRTRKHRAIFPRMPIEMLKGLTDPQNFLDFTLPLKLVEQYNGCDMNCCSNDGKMVKAEDSIFEIQNPCSGKVVTNEVSDKMSIQIVTSLEQDTVLLEPETLESRSHLALDHKTRIDIHNCQRMAIVLSSFGMFLAMQEIKKTEINIYKLADGTCIKSWNYDLKETVDGLWWMNIEGTANKLYLLQTNEKLSCCWISMYDPTENTGKGKASLVTIEVLHCVCVLPFLQFVVSSNRIVKYAWNKAERDFTPQLEMMRIEDSITSLCALNHQPNALIGSSSKMLYIWNHRTGLLLQQISFLNQCQELLTASSLNGLIVLHVLMASNNCSICARYLCNPHTGMCVKVFKAKNPASSKRISILNNQENFHSLHELEDGCSSCFKEKNLNFLLYFLK
ncbi:unnamed protein product [Clavelina lepadiformis]|uniref:Partner and localiser of BRCA2 WD40 domain-containing protein n=1 Tax=Clavelina lepadiformis TaxID=159417 RepID=A0ABP0G0A8_CLALP